MRVTTAVVCGSRPFQLFGDITIDHRTSFYTSAAFIDRQKDAEEKRTWAQRFLVLVSEILLNADKSFSVHVMLTRPEIDVVYEAVL